MGSTRLAEKVLADIVGRPMIWHMVERLRRSKSLDLVAIATSVEPQDAPIRDFAENSGIPYFAGSESDLLERLSGACRHFAADAVVRITGDCPLVDPEVVDDLLGVFSSAGDEVAYVSNEMPPTFPHGLDVEVYSAAALERFLLEVDDPFWREWFVPYLQNHQESYPGVNVTHDVDLSALRWTVDYAEDLEFVRAVYGRLYRPGDHFGMQDVLDLLQAHPEIQEINAMHAGNRNASYKTEMDDRGLQDEGFLNVG
jgi:spore coat polysaccharide biosynthesis protein SpsF (cytidylyltransferase family)